MPPNYCVIDVPDFVIHFQFNPTTACGLSNSFVWQNYTKKKLFTYDDQNFDTFQLVNFWSSFGFSSLGDLGRKRRRGIIRSFYRKSITWNLEQGITFCFRSAALVISHYKRIFHYFYTKITNALLSEFDSILIKLVLIIVC